MKKTLYFSVAIYAMCFPLVIAAQDCIGVVPAGSVHDFWKSVKAGSEKAGQELDLKIYFRGPHDESQIDAQRLIIDQVMNEACIGLMLAPNTQKRAEDVAKLKAMGIPTVYFDRDTGSADVISVIATDNYQSGVIAGKEMAKKMNHRGNVALLRMKKGVISTDAREKGFIDGATASGLSIVQDAYLGTRVGDARRNAEIALKNNLSSINGIFTPNESTTLGVIMALETMTHSDGIIHIGFDSNPSLVDALDKGTLYGLMVQQPFEMGYKGVYTLYRASLGQAYPSQIATGVLFVTKSNMADPNISRALTMDYE